MDTKELNESVVRLNARLRELSQEGLSRPIPVRKKERREEEGGARFSSLVLPRSPVAPDRNSTLRRRRLLHEEEHGHVGFYLS